MGSARSQPSASAVPAKSDASNSKLERRLEMAQLQGFLKYVLMKWYGAPLSAPTCGRPRYTSLRPERLVDAALAPRAPERPRLRRTGSTVMARPLPAPRRSPRHRRQCPAHTHVPAQRLTVCAPLLALLIVAPAGRCYLLQSQARPTPPHLPHYILVYMSSMFKSDVPAWTQPPTPPQRPHPTRPAHTAEPAHSHRQARPLTPPHPPTHATVSLGVSCLHRCICLAT